MFFHVFSLSIKSCVLNQLKHRISFVAFLSLLVSYIVSTSLSLNRSRKLRALLNRSSLGKELTGSSWSCHSTKDTATSPTEETQALGAERLWARSIAEPDKGPAAFIHQLYPDQPSRITSCSLMKFSGIATS